MTGARKLQNNRSPASKANPAITAFVRAASILRRRLSRQHVEE
jgi:hypothetical protein